MTNEQSRTVAALVEAREALRKEMSRLPFNINSACATRVVAWKHAHLEAQKVLTRNSLDPEPYFHARLSLLACGGATVDVLAKQTWG